MPVSLDRMLTIVRTGATLFVLAMIATGSPAQAGAVATARVISCDAGSCLLVRGRRSSSQDIVRVNGRAVDASGGTSWRVRLPVATIRDWSAPFARTLLVAIADTAGPVERSGIVRLPVGLLGDKVELASLIVRAR